MMQSEQEWKNRLDDGDAAAEQYHYFMRPEPREHLGLIYEIDDPVLGRTRVRDMKIGMVRNAADENRKEVQVFLHPFPHIRLSKAKPLQGWYKSKHEPKGTRPRPCFTEAVLTEPYGGFCQVGCQFCYVNSGFRGYRGSGLITVPEDYGEQIRVQLSRMKRAAAGYFSSFTDPFLSLENYYHNTQRAAEEFVKVGLPMFFLSRLAYPEWAMDLLTKNPHSYAQKSINTSSPEDWKYLSPGALPLEEHFKEIAELHRRRIYVSIQVNPIIPGVTSHDDIRSLFRRLAEVGANHVIVKFVEAGYSWAPTMVERMVKRFGDRGREFARLFTENMGGQRTVREEYRMKAHRIYSAAAALLGLTYATCYEYRYRRDGVGNILDRTGVSIGREFTTADQCHGHAVPVYYRKSEDEQFRPLEECPPSGCLYCADENKDNPGQPRCGDELAGQANALQFKEFKYPVGRGTPRTEVQELIQLGVRKDASR
jgi:DNA repair photolyase